jgi:hypothetical protein
MFRNAFVNKMSDLDAFGGGFEGKIPKVSGVTNAGHRRRKKKTAQTIVRPVPGNLISAISLE